MNHKIKRRWVAALRSGYYTQIFGQLGDYRNSNQLCAMGVLCAIDPGEYLAMSYPKAMIITDLNDCKRASFPQIADWIEDNL